MSDNEDVQFRAHFPKMAVLSEDVSLFFTLHSNAWSAAACLLAGIVGLIPAYSMDAFSVSDRSLVQSSPTECGVSECNCESSIMRRS